MGKGKPKKANQPLGRALQKQRFGTAGRRTHAQETEIHTAAIANPKADAALKLRSMTETSDLVELMHNAALAEADFTAQKANTIMITKESFSTATEHAIPSKDAIERLRLPRRPAWNKEMTAEEVDAHERAAFLDWRRNLAELEEEQKLLFTPFEKNLEVWRQLWRVVERSDIVLQIVDARNPLLFFSRDLQAYVKEVDATKQHVVLVNKADFLSLRARVAWARYFTRHSIAFLFWCATWDQLPVPLQVRLQSDENYEVPALNLLVPEDDADHKPAASQTSKESLTKDEQEEDEDDENEDEDEDEDEAEEELPRGKSAVPKSVPPASSSPAFYVTPAPVTAPVPSTATPSPSLSPSPSTPSAIASTLPVQDLITAAELQEAHIYARDELLATLVKIVGKKPQRKVWKVSKKEADEEDKEDGEAKGEDEEEEMELPRTVIGTVGYPNVGKSSTINVLAGAKRVNVSATPGKTKRFQTILLEEHVTVVDCPGLVFPNLLASKGEMICNGLLPIDQLRDAIPPVSLVCDRIAPAVLEQRYGVVLPEPDVPGMATSAHDLLQAYGYIRGFMTAHGSPDESRAARLVLKDYVSGRLLFCHKPPTADSPESLALSISPPLLHIPAPLFHVPRSTTAPTARTPTMRQSTHEAAFDRQAQVSAVSSGRSGQEGFTRITRPFSPVPLTKPSAAKRAATKSVNLSRFAPAPVTTAAATALPTSAVSGKQERKLG